MIIDTQHLESGRVVRSDVCIVGAGAAGITIARELSSRGLSACLLESGGLKFDDDHQSLYEGRLDGSEPARNDAYLTRSRLRYFGGSTNHWNGWCRPLDDLDFSVRPWIPDSGWPIGSAELSPYYGRAAEFLDIESFDDPRDHGLGWEPQSALLDNASFVLKRYHFSPPTRFGSKYHDELRQSDDTQVYLHSNVVGMDVDDAGVRIRRVRAATLTGVRVEFVADQYVLAAGGIENARLLLASNDVHTGGLGNGNDLVGRYFMEHPHLNSAGYVVLGAPLPQRDRYRRRDMMRAALCPSPALQREHGLLNLSITFSFNRSDRTSSRDRLVAVRSALERLESDSTGEPGEWVRCFVRAEQSPNRESRITLTDELDPLGVRRVELAWKMSQRDLDSIRRTLELLALQLGRQGRGWVRVHHRAGDPWKGVGGGAHHMGTTRMGELVSTSVVDPDCRIHGLDNLFVAGSSVFPTVGFANLRTAEQK